jgi:membrane-associated phospholipid phosphatase
MHVCSRATRTPREATFPARFSPRAWVTRAGGGPLHPAAWTRLGTAWLVPPGDRGERDGGQASADHAPHAGERDARLANPGQTLESSPLPVFRSALWSACLLALTANARADLLDGPPPPVPTPIDALGSDLVEAFSGYNLFYYGGAVLGTGVMAFSGADQAIRVRVQEHLALPAYGDTALYAGYIIPAVVAPSVYLVGLASHNSTVTGAGSAAVQALGVSLVTMGLLKIAVGRVYPLNGGDPNASDRLDHPSYAHTFQPFQSAWPLPAWPSGHTIGTISVVAALSGYFPDQLWIPLLGYPLGVGIGVGMVVGDRHWASDVLAGALIGHAIGYSIGRSFRRRSKGGVATRDALELVPLLAPGEAGVALQFGW